MAIHERAATGFARAASEYERVRPSYPAEAIDFLVRELDLGPGRRALDLAAGTGKLTRLLAPSGTELVAVEPVAEMRAELERAVPGVRAVAGTAEAIPLEDAAVDAVLVAQAFHWFDAERALAEIHRVLRPRGRLALVWNTWREDLPLTRRILELIEPYRGDTPAHARGDWRAIVERTTLFGPLEQHTFENPFRVDRDAAVARVATISFVAALDEPTRAALLARIRTVVDEEPEPVRFEQQTDVFWCRRADDSRGKNS